MATPSSGTISLKLLVDTKRQKVLYAEAGKDFIDFLFTLLSLPAGTIIRLLSKEAMVGSFGKLYESVENLKDEYFQPDVKKDIVLKPKEPNAAGPNILGLLTHVEPKKIIYLCPYNTSHRFLAEDPSARCPLCNQVMSSAAAFVSSPSSTVQTINYSGAGKEGYVKGLLTYIVMDDLEVMPLSTISSLALLKSVKDVGALEQNVVDLGMDEGVELLKASLQSKSVLTDVFLEGKNDAVPPAEKTENTPSRMSSAVPATPYAECRWFLS